jgi:hypothetical protein
MVDAFRVETVKVLFTNKLFTFILEPVSVDAIAMVFVKIMDPISVL